MSLERVIIVDRNTNEDTIFVEPAYVKYLILKDVFDEEEFENINLDDYMLSFEVNNNYHE